MAEGVEFEANVKNRSNQKGKEKTKGKWNISLHARMNDVDNSDMI